MWLPSPTSSRSRSRCGSASLPAEPRRTRELRRVGQDQGVRWQRHPQPSFGLRQDLGPVGLETGGYVGGRAGAVEQQVEPDRSAGRPANRRSLDPLRGADASGTRACAAPGRPLPGRATPATN